MVLQSNDTQRFCIARTAVQSINTAERAGRARRRLALIIERLAIASDGQRDVLAGRNVAVGRQGMQLVEIDMLRITAEGLLEVRHEGLGFRRIQIAPFFQSVTLDVGWRGSATRT